METTPAVQEPDVGLIGRMIRVFYAPSETFEAVQQRHSWRDWVVPTVIVAILSAGATYMTMPILTEIQTKAIQERVDQNPNLTAEQKAQQREMMEKVSKVTGTASLAMVPVTLFVMLFIFGGIYLLIGRFILGGEVSYGQMLAVHAYALLIAIPQLIVLTPIRQAKGEMLLALGPGLLLSEEMLDTFVGGMIKAVDIFMLWQIGVAAVGLAVLSRAAVGKAVVSLLVIWVLYLVVAGATGGFMPGS